MKGKEKIDDYEVVPLISTYPVGTVLDYKGTLLKVTEDTHAGCSGCFFNDILYNCHKIECCRSERTDKKKVIYTKS